MSLHSTYRREYTVHAFHRNVCNIQSFAALWCSLPPTIRGHIPARAINDVGAKAGSEGLKCWDCSPCTTQLFSVAQRFQTVPHFLELISLTGCICICQHLQLGTVIILDGAFMRKLSTLWMCGTVGFYPFGHEHRKRYHAASNEVVSHTGAWSCVCGTGNGAFVVFSV